MPSPVATALFWLAIGLDAVFFGFRPLYRGWNALRQAGGAGWSPRMTPGSAILRLLVPLYSVYWLFEVLPGFATDYGDLSQLRRLPGRPLRRGPYIAVCLIWILALAFIWGGAWFDSNATAGVGVLLGMLGMLVYCWVLSSICEAVNRLAAVSQNNMDVS